MLRKTKKYWFELAQNPLPYAAQIADWFYESYSRRPWNEGFYVCPTCCPAENPSSGLQREQQYWDEHALCRVHNVPLERFWCERRVNKYLQHLLDTHGEKFVFLGLFDEEGLKGFIWGFPIEKCGKKGLYLDFIFVIKSFRRRKDWRNLMSVLFLIFRYRFLRNLGIIKILCDYFLDCLGISQVDMMREFLTLVEKRGYEFLFTRIVVSSSRLRHNVWSVGFNHFCDEEEFDDNAENKRSMYFRMM